MMIFELCKHHCSDYLWLSSLLWCSYVWHEVPTKITKENNSELFQDFVFFSCSFWLAQLIKGTWVVTRKIFFSLLWNQSQTVVKLGKRIQYGLFNEKEWSVGFVLMKQWLSWFSLFVRQNGFPINNLCLNNKKKKIHCKMFNECFLLAWFDIRNVYAEILVIIFSMSMVLCLMCSCSSQRSKKKISAAMPRSQSTGKRFCPVL